MNILKHPVFKSSLGLGLGFMGAFLGLFFSRSYLSNTVDIQVLDIILGVNVLTALIVVLAVEGFTSAVPVNVKEPLPLIRGMLIISVLFTLVIGSILLLVFNFFIEGYSFLQEYWWLGFLSLLIIAFVGAGQMLEAAAAVIGKNGIIVWRRSSVQFITLVLFILLTLASIVNDFNVLLVWFIVSVIGGGLALGISLILFFRGEGYVKQVSFKEAWHTVMPKYVYHHLSKLGIVLPRFIIPVILLALFGLDFNTRFVILWTILGFLSMAISAVSRGYMSHYVLNDSWKVAWQTWLMFFLLPAVTIFVFSNPIIVLFGENFSDLSGLLQIGLISMLFYSFVDLMLAWLRVQGFVKLSSWVSVTSGIVLVVSAIMSGFIGGLLGVVYIYVGVYSLFALILGVIYLKVKRR